MMSLIKMYYLNDFGIVSIHKFNIFKNMGQPRPLFVYFRCFETNNTIFTTNQCENIHPVYGAGIWTHNLLNMSCHP